MKKYKVTRYFDGYPEGIVYCTCDTIEEAKGSERKQMTR